MWGSGKWSGTKGPARERDAERPSRLSAPLVSGQGPKVPPGTRSVPLLSGLVVESGELMKLQTPSMTKARKLLETLLSGQRTRHGREQLESSAEPRNHAL